LIIPLAAAAWYIPRYIRSHELDVEKQMIFEAAPVRTVEVLHLDE
jgi:hypothetical protein